MRNQSFDFIIFHTAENQRYSLFFFQSVDLEEMFPCMTELELKLPAYAAHRVRKLQTSQPLIEEIDSQPESPGRHKPMPHNKPFIYRSHSPMPPVSVWTWFSVSVPRPQSFTCLNHRMRNAQGARI